MKTMTLITAITPTAPPTPTAIAMVWVFGDFCSGSVIIRTNMHIC